VTAVGMFAGRGDVVLAMLMAMVFGIWIGWYLHKGYLRYQAWRNKEKSHA
jgi:hypothetical protein